MNRILIAALAACTVMSCNKTNESGYIGPSEIQIADGKMTPEVLLSFGRLSDPQLSPDGTKILYGVSYTSIADNRSCRNLFLCNVDGSGKVQLTRYAKSVSNARWSNDGNTIYFLQGGQIWKAPLTGSKLGKKVKLSNVSAGISEFKLSPDQANVLYVSSIPGAVKTPKDFDPALDKAQAFVAEDLMYRHWDHWVTETPRSYVAPFGGAEITETNSMDILGSADPGFELPTEPFGGAEQLAWAPDSRHIAYSCRKLVGKEYAFSTNSDIYIYDIVTGEEVQVTCGGGYDTDPAWSEDGCHLAWLSMARDGYEADKTRLFVADVEMPAESGDGQAAGIRVCNARDLSADFKYFAEGPVWHGDALYFSAIAEGLQAIYRTGAEGGITRLTADDLWYDFHSPWGFAEIGGKECVLSTYCSMEFPTELVAVNADGSDFCQITKENEHILSQLKSYSTEARYVKTVDGKDMLTWVLFPPEFDASKQYPAIEICLGGPQGTLSQGWSYRWNYRLMAAQGYVVVLPNRRGTTAFGSEWCEQISGDYGGLNMQDYLCAGRMIKSEPYVQKLAACGASYGGYSVYNLMGIHGDLYDCFIAHAGIFDESALWYTTEEMWFANWDNGGLTEYAYEPGQTGPKGDGMTFGGMQQAGAPYGNSAKALHHYANDPATKVTKWHTPILCIHGMMDFRIPYTQGMAAFNAAQMMGVPSKLVIFPEENHWILQPQNALFWHRTYFEWLDQWTK